MPTKPNFDPVTMGLDKQWTGRNMERTDAHDTPEEGTQTGWSKSLGGGKTQQYDMDGNDLGITDDKSTWDSLKPVVAIAGLALGAGALNGAFGGAGAAAGAAGDAGAGMGWMGGADGVGAGTMGDVVGTEAFSSTASTFSTEGFKSAAQQMPNFSLEGSAASEIQSVGYMPQGMSIVEQEAARLHVGANMGGSSTLGTFTGAGYAAPTAGSLTSGVTAGGSMVTEAGLTSAAGASSAFTGTLGTASPSLWSTIVSAVKDPVSYITKALGIENTEIVKGLREVLNIGGTVAGGTSLFDYLMKGLQGGMANSAATEIQNSRNQNALDVANIGATSALDQIKLKDQQTQDANKRYSASVSGINYGGLINSTPKPLTRNDGSRVFSGNGLINRG